jgi:hypothetical protein
VVGAASEVDLSTAALGASGGGDDTRFMSDSPEVLVGESAVTVLDALLGASGGGDDTRFMSDSLEALLGESAVTVPDALTCCDTEACSNFPAVLMYAKTAMNMPITMMTAAERNPGLPFLRVLIERGTTFSRMLGYGLTTCARRKR